MIRVEPTDRPGWFFVTDPREAEIRPARFFTPDQAKDRHRQFHSLIATEARP